MKFRRIPLLLTLCASMVAFVASSCATNPSTDFPHSTGYSGTYYNSITAKTSSELKDQLTELNKKKRTRTVGYKPALNNPSAGFYVTDPGNGPNTITSFYSGRSVNGTSGLNREHVWPESRGGGLVDNDIHMIRPTLNAENGNRGNSFYVEGKCSQSSGWDPAATDFGQESYRGDAARIIFYCVIAAGKDNSGRYYLKLVDYTNDNTSNRSMGKLSTLLAWNRKYPVTDREKTRNNGAERLQGNRNPFIDHPEYADIIWG